MITIQALNNSLGGSRWVFETKVTWAEYQAMSNYRSNEGKTWKAIL